MIVTCSCEYADATSIGDSTKNVLPIRDPDCAVHGDEVPVVCCIRCGDDEVIKRATWEEHDPHYRGWWCKACRVDIGMDVPDQKLTMTLPRSHGKTAVISAMASNAAIPPHLFDVVKKA